MIADVERDYGPGGIATYENLRGEKAKEGIGQS